MTFRHLLSWKPLFYAGLIPVLRRLGPATTHRVLGGLGQIMAAWPAWRRQLSSAVERVKAATGADWGVVETRRGLQKNVMRFLARDCPLDGMDDARFAARFDVQGFDHLQAALDAGRGVILVGSHLGAHLSAPHWIYRRNLPLRMLIQRPGHISRLLNQRFDADDANPQSGFFLRRDLTPEDASKRIFRTRAALRDGMIVYLKADVPWAGPNTQPGRFLGHERSFQSLWAEFAARFGSPVVPVFCTHLPSGRYALTFEQPWTIRRGEERAFVGRYLSLLESQILEKPAEAVAHLLWPCYGPPQDAGEAQPPKRRKPSRRVEAAPSTAAA